MAKPSYFDAHTHAHFAAFEKDWNEVINRALEAGVWLINVGTQKDTSRRAVEVAHEYKEGVYAAVGLHPIHTEKSYHDEKELGTFSYSQECENVGFTSHGEEFDCTYYKKLAEDPKVVAIGECGLDYYHGTWSIKHETNNLSGEVKEKQKRVFELQIRLAYEVKKPLMIHCRDAFADLIGMLHVSRSMLHEAPGIIHFFTGTKEDATALLDLGFSFTFGGVITFTRDYDEVVKMIPLDRILSETDAPYVAPVPYRGKRNEPAYVVEVVKKLAEIKNVSVEEMKNQIWENARRVFGI